MTWSGAKRMFAPFQSRDFRLLWIGQTISAFGNPLQDIALAWLVLQLTNSPLALAVVFLFLSIPQAVLLLIGGVLTDRFDARTVMLWSDATRVATSSAIAMLTFVGWVPLWLLCVILVLHGAANGIFYPAASSITPRIVPSTLLDSANSLRESISQLGTSVGALPAGLLVASGHPAFAFALNACSFALAVVTALFMRPLSRESSSLRPSPLQEALQGFAYLARLPWLIALVLIEGCVALAALGPTTVGFPLLAKGVFHNGAQGYSLLLWSFGCGSVIGLFFPALVRLQRHRGLLVCAIQGVEALLLAGIVFVPFPLALLFVMSSGLLNGIALILFLSLLQARVERKMLGRMMSFLLLASFGLLPLSQAAAGIVAQQAGIHVLFVSAGAVLLLGALIGLLVPSFRCLE